MVILLQITLWFSRTDTKDSDCMEIMVLRSLTVAECLQCMLRKANITGRMSSITMTRLSGCRPVIASHSYGNQQPVKIKDWFSHFKEFCMRGEPVTTADLIWSDHGCSFPLKSSSGGHLITKLETVRSNFSLTTVTTVCDRTHSYHCVVCYIP